MKEIVSLKIDERDNFADPETKQLVMKAW